MSSERHQRVKTLFLQAVELPPAERATFLERICAGDASLRREVEAMLAFEEEQPRFLEQPAPEEEETGTPASDEGARIADIVFERLRRRLGVGGGHELPPLAVRAVRRVCGEVELHSEEIEALEAAADGEAEDVLSVVLGLRVQRAMRAACEALGESGAGGEPPEVLVLRAGEDRADTERRMQRIVRRLRQHLQRSEAGGSGELVLLAAGHVFAKLKRLLPSTPGSGAASVTFHGAEGVAAVAPAGEARSGSRASIEVIEANVRLEELERRVRLRIEKVRTASRAAHEPGLAAAPVPLPSAPAPVAPAVPPADDDPLIGALFHLKYRIVRCIGRGGFGAVYEAMDERGAGNRVAIKVLSGPAAESAARQQSFKDEARRVTRLSHPNVVDWKVFDETEAGVPYFVMELVEGEEFSETLKREGALEPARTARLLLQVLDALRSAHHLSATESILHLDLKPQNLFLVPGRSGREEQLKVYDFGIGQYIGDEMVEGECGEDGEAGVAAEPDSGPSSLTFARPPGRPTTPSSRVRRSLGCTPEYASPEQCAHVLFEPDIMPLDGRSDLYSLGVMAFEMLTGTRPFQARGQRLEVLRMHRELPPPTFESRGVRVPRPLARFVMRCLEKERDDRWRDTQQAYEALHGIVHPPVWKAVAKVTVPLVLVGLVLGIWLWATRDARVPVAGLVGASGTDLENRPLYLGPQHREETLRLLAAEGLPRDTSGSWSLVGAKDGRILTGWSAAWAGPGEVTVSAPSDASGRLEERVELRLEGDRLRSRTFSAFWIGEGTWSVTALELAGRPADQVFGLALDPAGLFLNVWIEGVAKDLVSEVSARVAGGPSNVLPRGTSQGDRDRYRLGLEDAALSDGQNQISLVVRDQAGLEWTRELRLDVVRAPLELARLELVDAGGTRTPEGRLPSCNRSAGRYVLSPRTQAMFSVELSRACDLAWSVFTSTSSQPALRGSAVGQRSIEAVLAGIGELAGGEPFEGSLRIAAREDAYVLHRDGSTRGQVDQELFFRYEKTEPRFTVQWASQQGRRDLRAADGAALFTNADRAELLVTRQEAVPMRIEATWWPAGRPDEARLVTNDELRNPLTGQTSVPVELAADGRYELRVRSFRFDTSEKTVAERADLEEGYSVVLDRTAPRLMLVGIEEGAIVTEASAAPAVVGVRFSALTREEEAAVDLRWEMERLAPAEAWRSSGDLLQHDPRDSARVVLAEPWREAPAQADGGYRLVLSGTDRAGNALAVESVEFEVSLRGPDVSLEAPSGVGRWYRDSATGRWVVRARATDANGVADVACELLADDAGAGDGTGVSVPLEPASASSSTERVFVGSILLPYTLSEKSVRLSFSARDEHGSTSEWTSAALELPRIDRPSPERISVDFGGREVESMRLVRGNASYSYLFGGRGDELENATFVSAGLQPFNPSPRNTRARSWQIEFTPGQITDFYLDEHEVSARQFLVFLHDQDGVAASGMDSARRDALVSALAGDLPVSGVTWDESAAYARWVGKRLPSWVEWEFAVRGGSAYRPFAAQPSAATALRVEAAKGTDPRAREDSWDWTPDRRFAGLCSSVAEWTCTPAGRAQGSYPHLLARALPEVFLRADGPREDAYWIVGGGHEEARIDFTQATHHPRGLRSAAVGFRCAVSLRDVQERLGHAASPSAPFFEESQ